jgi:hypothetical protein
VARDKNRLDVLLGVIIRADLFLLDEVGYLPLQSEDATFLFEAVSRRYEARKPIILASNLRLSAVRSAGADLEAPTGRQAEPLLVLQKLPSVDKPVLLRSRLVSSFSTGPRTHAAVCRTRVQAGPAVLLGSQADSTGAAHCSFRSTARALSPTSTGA